MPIITDIDTSQADFQEGSLIDVEADAGGYLRLKKLFPDTDLYLPEVSASGTIPSAYTTFGPVDCTGLTKQNAYLSIELKCSNWSDLSGITQIENTSSGTWDVEEWGYNPTSLDITSSYKTFLLPLSDFGTAGGELVVSEIDYIRFYAYFNTTQTISWRNAKIIGRLGPGTRISPQLDLSAVGMVESSSVSFNLHAGLSFDGVDDYAQATIPSMTTGKLRFYAKVAGNMPTGNTTLVDIGSWGSQTGWGVWIKSSSNNEIGVRDSGGTYPYSTTVLPDSPYTKIEAVYDGTDITLYVNDSLVYTLTNAVVNSASTITLGSRLNDIEWLNGTIDNVEILDLNDNLIAQYKMNEGSGTALVDSAGTYNGTIYGASWLHGLIETRISTDDGTNWSAWKTCTDGGAIPDLPYGTDVSTALLECRQTLSTSDPTVTPQLESITVEVSGEFGSFFAFPF